MRWQRRISPDIKEKPVNPSAVRQAREESATPFWMQLCISIGGRVCPSVGLQVHPSVRPYVRMSCVIFERQIWPFLRGKIQQMTSQSMKKLHLMYPRSTCFTKTSLGCNHSKSVFLVVCTQLFKSLCWSVGQLVNLSHITSFSFFSIFNGMVTGKFACTRLMTICLVSLKLHTGAFTVKVFFFSLKLYQGAFTVLFQ